MKLNPYSDELAEALFWYVHQPDIYDDFLEMTSINGYMSLAEYVEYFKLHDFKLYCIDEYGFHFET